MANRSFRGLGTGGWRLAEKGTQSPRSPRSRVFLFAAFAAFALIVVPTVAFAQPTERARTEALARRATERLRALQREADRLASEERTVLGDLRKLEIDRQLGTEQLKRVGVDAAKVEAELAAITERMTSLETAQRKEQPELRARLVEIYKLGQARYLRLLLATPDLRRLGQSTRTVAVLAKLDRDRVASHQQTVGELKRTRKTLEESRTQLTALRKAVERAQVATERAAQARRDLVRDIDQKRDVNAQLAGELQTAQQKLQAMLREMPTGVAATSGVEPASLPLRPFRSDLPWPVMGGQVKRRFSRGSSSNGIEITAAEGADAVAIHDGLVAFAGTFSGFGNLVILDHGSQTFSLYGDLLEITVKKGARIEHGQPVGTVGRTQSGAEGLYFELRVDGQPVDPLQWLKRR
jgi:septal ring factor EnvC (AmiA/AmiB activator)